MQSDFLNWQDDGSGHRFKGTPRNPQSRVVEFTIIDNLFYYTYGERTARLDDSISDPRLYMARADEICRKHSWDSLAAFHDILDYEEVHAALNLAYLPNLTELSVVGNSRDWGWEIARSRIYGITAFELKYKPTGKVIAQFQHSKYSSWNGWDIFGEKQEFNSWRVAAFSLVEDAPRKMAADYWNRNYGVKI